MSEHEMLREVHHALIGDPLDPNAEPGLMQIVKDHHIILHGKHDQPGLIAREARNEKDISDVRSYVNVKVAYAAGALGIIVMIVQYVTGHAH